MAVLLDTGVLYAYYDRSDAWHERSLALFRDEEGGLVIPAPVIPEVDHLLGKRLGIEARRVFYAGMVEGEYFVADLPQERYGRVLELNERFASLDLGFVDAAVVALSEWLALPRIATADRRDFEPLAAALGLTLLP